MYVLSDKFAVMTECLLTNTTDIRVLTAMYMLMSYKTVMMIEHFITHKYKGIHHYVCFDVLSESRFELMLSYKPQSYKDVQHYVCIDVV